MNDETQQQNGNPQESLSGGLTAETLKTALSEVFAESQQNQQPQTREMSPEEEAKYLEIWNPDKQFLDSFYGTFGENVDENAKMAPFVSLRSGLMKQSQRFTQLLVEQAMAQMQQQIAPMFAHYQQTVRAQTEDAFYKNYPELSEHRDIVQAVAGQLYAKKTQYKTAQEANEILAKNVEAVLKKVNPAFALSSGSTQQKQTTGGMPGMATVTSPGSRGGGKPTGKATGDDIWD